MFVRKGQPSAIRTGFALRALLVFLFLGVAPLRAWAGGGPENVLLVVNANSWASVALANHYAQWRQIPSINILYVNWRMSEQPLPVAEFRRLLLSPVTQELQRRGIEEQIDYIVYSCDFPTEIDITEDLAAANVPEQVTRTASLTGLTYHWTQSLFVDPRYVVPAANNYSRERPESADVARTHGFRQWYGWGENGALQEAGGNHYLLSAMLAVTQGHGNSVRESLRALNAAARADATRPPGTMYFVQNSDIRSRARDDRYTAAVRALRTLDVQSSVIRGALPRAKQDVQGVVMGIRQFDWPASGSGIRPGAFCDNLTDLGGALRAEGGQSPFTEFIRYGAAGASGPVATPYNIAAQFPSPLVQVHYASGCTLAEAFYQSISCPFQTLLVCDPLCRPWARPPVVELQGVTNGATVTGNLSLTPSVAGAAGAAAPDRFHFFLDGRRVGMGRQGDDFALDTTMIPDGHHELRVVAIENGPIETQGRAIVAIQTANHDRKIELTASPADRVRWGEKVTITARAPGAKSIRIQRFGALLEEITGDHGSIELEAKSLGYGPVRLDAVVLGDAVADQVFSAPLTLQVLPANPLAAQQLDFASLPEGLKLTVDNQAAAIQDASGVEWLAQQGVGAQQPFQLSAVYDARQADIYQFHVACVGDLSISVDGQLLEKFTSEQPYTRIVPVVLAAGAHRIELVGTTGAQPRLEVRFGNQGVLPAKAPAFRYEP